MRILSAGVSVLFASLASAAAAEKPRLAVLIVADQMSDDLLDLHGPHLEGGFHRLLTQGRRFTAASVDHAPTNSMPGHFSAASGMYPAHHGVIDNSYVEQIAGEPVVVQGFSDPDCALIADNVSERKIPDRDGVGPARFDAPTIVEWALASDKAAKFASLGVGGGVSALHAGAAKGPVFWYMPDRGAFGSSTCYLDRFADWTLEFNATLKARFMNEDWTLSAPPGMRASLGPDAASHENNGSDTAFPHKRPADVDALNRWFNFAPFADIAMLDLAKAAVDNERLGEDDSPDVLTIGLSMLDHVGHRYGPFSVEQADTLYKIDAALGEFFDFLDRKVGEGRWVAALTADHGAPPAPENAKKLGVEGARRVSAAEVNEAIKAIADAAAEQESRAAKAEAGVAAAAEFDWVYRVIKEADLENDGDEKDDAILRLYANAHRRGRTSLHPLYADEAGRSAAEHGLIVVPDPYAVVDWAASIHGSPFDYDRDVEMIFMGPGVKPGASAVPARTIDVAPTLAKLAGIRAAGELDGKVLPLK